MAENFDLIFGQNASQQYAWSDSDYQDGWETVGNIPPTAAQFDALQRRNDMKTKELNDNLTPLVNANTAETRQPATAYNEGDMKYSPLLPTGWFLSCAVAGTTSASEIVLPSPVVENATVTDGTVTWTIRKIGSGGGEAVGVIKAFAGNGDIPSGYLLCDGAAVSRTMFPDLFAVIGTTYGSGDGSTTFNVPDFNTAARFAQGGTVAGTEISAGLPNIEGVLSGMISTSRTPGAGAFNNVSSNNATITSGGSSYFIDKIGLDASLSSAVYGNSTTVQPESLTTRFIIKAFDGQTADSALIDITQYAQELAGKANITGSNLVHHRDVITTSGTYTAPVTGLYKVTVKGGGGGGAGSGFSSPTYMTGGSGGEGGTTIGFERMNVGDTATVVIGAGGTGGSVAYMSNDATDGGDSSVSVNSNTYTGGGGHKGDGWIGGAGGSGTIAGASGQNGMQTPQGTNNLGGIGGGNGGSTQISVAITGGGGLGAPYIGAATRGGDGGDGFAIFEYYTPGA